MVMTMISIFMTSAKNVALISFFMAV